MVTDTGTELGTVIDVIIEVGGVAGGRCEVVGRKIVSTATAATVGKVKGFVGG